MLFLRDPLIQDLYYFESILYFIFRRTNLLLTYQVMWTKVVKNEYILMNKLLIIILVKYEKENIS